MEACLFLAPQGIKVDKDSRILIRRHIRRFYTQGARRYLFELLPGLPLAFGEEALALRKERPHIFVGGIRVTGRKEWESGGFEPLRELCWQLDAMYNEFRDGVHLLDITEEWIDLADTMLCAPHNKKSQPTFLRHVRFADHIGKRIVVLGE